MKFKKGDILVYKNKSTSRFKGDYKVINIKDNKYILMNLRNKDLKPIDPYIETAERLLELIKTRRHPLTSIFK